MSQATHIVVVIGGAVAGSEAVASFTAAGITCVVIEQNARPYGKIEDGLPKWHVKLRQQEYDKIDEKLGHPLVHFVPNTRIAPGLALEAILGWGASAVVLANGAWRDRSLPIPGVDDFVGRGFYYQNPFTYWFNHYDEVGYAGPVCDVTDKMIVVGGGLASIDIVKMLQLETVGRALRQRGIAIGIEELEHGGIPKVLAKHSLTFEGLGLEGCTLYYRRTAEDMPLADLPDGTAVERVRSVSAKILAIAQKKYLFRFCPLRAPVGLVSEGDRLVGLRFAETRMEGGKVRVTDTVHEVRGPITISSIGSIPLPLDGLPMKGETFDVEELDSGKVRGIPGLFVVGNAVTGKGNINVSYKHARDVGQRMLEARAFADVTEEKRTDILRLVEELQKRAGMEGSYKDYIARVRPPPRT